MKNSLFLTAFIFLLFSCDQAFISDAESTNTISGSYANMLTIGDYMYVINKAKLITFSIEEASNPQLLDEQDVGFNIESLLFHKGNLFIGSSASMFIYNLNKSGIPERKSATSYFANDPSFCQSDPIAIRDHYAYVTLSTSTTNVCGWRESFNELRIYDITDIGQPEILQIIDMDQPKGIAVDGDLLFVCETNLGLKVFDISDRGEPEILFESDQFNAFDVIADDGLLIVVGPEKLHEFSYDPDGSVEYLSSLNLD